MKKIIWICLLVIMSISVMGLTVTRQAPASANPSSTFTVTYTAVGDNTRWAVPIEDSITGGCTPTSAKTVIMHDIGEATTLTKTYTFTAPSSGSCTFTGFWTDTSNAKHDFTNVVVSIGSCSGSSTQSCTIGSCAGTQTRTCTNGVWSDWGSCIKNDPNCGICTDTCSSKGYVCGTQTICGTSVNCGSCSSGMICSNGQCISGYVKQYEKRCYNDDVYWYDSNGERQDRYDECDSDEECDDGRCEEDCKSKDYKECYNGDVYWYDSCDDRGSKYDDCDDETEDCVDGKCVSKVRCGNYKCDLGESCSLCPEDCGICQVTQLSKKEPEKKEVVVITQPTEKITGFVTQPSIIKEESIFSGTSGNILIGVGIGLGLFIVILLFIWVLRK